MADFDLGGMVSSIDLKGLGGTVLNVLLIIGVVGLLGGGLFFLWWKKKASSKKLQKVKLGWWEELENSLRPLNMEDAEEITMPNSPLSLFYVKKRNIWLPRFSRPIDRGLYYLVKTRNGEIVNFIIKGLNKDGHAEVDYDHTDMRWGAENAREFVKRNYKDKSQKWWQLYKSEISTAIYIFIITFSLVILLVIGKGTADKILSGVNQLINQLGDAIKQNACSVSGLKPA